MAEGSGPKRDEQDKSVPSGRAGAPPPNDPLLKALTGLIRNSSQCLDAAVFEYAPSSGGALNIGRFATLSGMAPSSNLISMVRASPDALSGAPGCFDAGRYSERGEARHVVGLRFSDNHHAFLGGYAVFRNVPDTNVWSALHGTITSGAQIILAARKGLVQQQANADGHAFQARMFQALQRGTDAYWETDALSTICNVVLFSPRIEAEILKMLEGKSLASLLELPQAQDLTDFHNREIELETLDRLRITVSISGRRLADGTIHGTARLIHGTQNAQLTRTAARTLVERLEEAHRVEAVLRCEAELVLDGLSILTSGRGGPEIFKSLLELLEPALEFRDAVVLQRNWSGQVASAAATSEELLTLDWTEAGSDLFRTDDVAVTLAVPHQLALPPMPSGTQITSALCIKLRGGSKPALLLCLHEQPEYFGIRHLGLGTRLSLIASQAFISEEERQRVIESAKLASIGELAAGIVHEINQPLTSVTLGIHNLKELLNQNDGVDPERIRTKLDRIRGQIERITKIVANMRVLARRSDGINEPFPLEDTIRQAAEIVQHKLTTAGIMLELSICDENAAGNPLEFGQVILNLLTNAHDAILEKTHRISDTESVTRRIMVTATVIDQDWLEVLIRDTGTGFPNEAEDHAFEAFATTKKAGKGTGLGLTLCRRIVENMAGTIMARNWSDGAEICIRLKRSPANKN